MSYTQVCVRTGRYPPVDTIHSINAVAEVIKTTNSVVDLNKILGVSSFSIEKTLEVDPEFLDDEEAEEAAEAAKAAADACADDACKDDSHGHAHSHGHGHGGALYKSNPVATRGAKAPGSNLY